MKKLIKSSVWLALLLAVIYGIFSFVPYIFSNPGCGERARNTLLKIKEDFNTKALNWDEEIPIEDWDGVTINSDGCVTALSLGDEYFFIPIYRHCAIRGSQSPQSHSPKVPGHD